MGTLDPGLKFLQSDAAASFDAFEGAERAGMMAGAAGAPQEVKVLVHFTGDASVLDEVGFRARTVAGDVASGTVPLDQAEALSDHPSVARVELARPMQSELDDSLPETRATVVHSGPPGHRGAGVIVGIIDSGIDITHGCFLRPDGSSRILSIWDQRLTPQAGEQNPTGFAYGVEYSATEIDASIAAGGPPNTVRHTDGDTTSGHGTHVAGIAAGDGSVAGGGEAAFSFVGVAPEADIIVVRNDAFGGGGRGMGDSANTLDAVKYIFDRAQALNQPVVINQSQGDNVGPHDGTSLLERGIDNLLGGAGLAMVKSAGNEGARNRHATGTVTAGATQNVRFNGPTGNRWQDVIDIWYDGSDRFSISLTAPDGTTSASVAAGTTTTLTLAGGNSVFVDSTLNNPSNNDNRIYLRISRGSQSAILSGGWSLNLTGDTVVNGRFDAWIDRNIAPVPTFTSHRSAAGTISIPGTARKMITVGSYVTSGAGVGSLSTFSSRGPTRDNRTAPTVSAPGQTITSARAAGISRGSGAYHGLPGTSMAAPHVAGAVALMLERNPTLTQDDLRQCLESTAQADGFTGTVPNNDWGAGKLDAKGAFDCAAPALAKLKFADDPLTLKFSDDGATLTGADAPKFKFSDDAGTFKFLDDPRTFKFSDDVGTDPRIDTVKSPALDKSPFTDAAGPFGPGGGVQPAPFVLSTPHHSNTWSESYPEAHAQSVAELAEQIKGYETLLSQAQAEEQAGRLSEADRQKANALYDEYLAQIRAYEAMSRKT